MSRSALVLCLLAAVCGAAHPSRLRGFTPDVGGRMLGGRPATISQFPWHVSLEYLPRTLLRDFCSGSIISSTWVLTAARCIRDRNAQEVYVRAGSSFRMEGGIVYPVATIITHEYYNRNIENDYDVGLLELVETIEFGSRFQAVNLGNSDIVNGTKVNVTGWSTTDIFGDKPYQLNAITTSIIISDTCIHLLWDKIITMQMICAGEQGCQGDRWQGPSGAALVHGNTQYGIFSSGNACARPDRPAIYSFVPALRGWITDKTGV